jgi:hypothetical protein
MVSCSGDEALASLLPIDNLAISMAVSMATTFLEQLEEWNRELHGLKDRLALAPSHGGDLQEELRVTMETLEAELFSLETAYPSTNLSDIENRRLAEVGSRGFFLTTPNGIVKDANAVGEVLLNCPSQWLLGQPLLVFVAREQRRAYLEKLVHFKHSSSLQVEWHLFLQPMNAQPFRAVINVSKTFGHDGELLRLTWLVRPLG